MSRFASYLAAGVAATALLAGATAAQAADDGFNAGDILLRARVLGVFPDTSSAIDGIGGAVDITNAYVPELDVSYFATPNLAFELIAGTTRHGVQDKASVLGDVPLGSVWLLPPTLTAQWHFLPKEKFNPYLGAGVNYTVFYNVQHSSVIDNIKYQNSWGYALQAGLDYNITDRWYLNVDLKKLFLDTKVKINGGAITGRVHIDPYLAGVGLGYRF